MINIIINLNPVLLIDPRPADGDPFTGISDEYNWIRQDCRGLRLIFHRLKTLQAEITSSELVTKRTM